MENYCTCKKDYSWNPSICSYENSKYLKSIGDISVNECDEIIIVMHNVSTKKTNAIVTNVTTIVSIRLRDRIVTRMHNHLVCI